MIMRSGDQLLLPVNPLFIGLSLLGAVAYEVLKRREERQAAEATQREVAAEQKDVREAIDAHEEARRVHPDREGAAASSGTTDTIFKFREATSDAKSRSGISGASLRFRPGHSISISMTKAFS